MRKEDGRYSAKRADRSDQQPKQKLENNEPVLLSARGFLLSRKQSSTRQSFFLRFFPSSIFARAHNTPPASEGGDRLIIQVCADLRPAAALQTRAAVTSSSANRARFVARRLQSHG
jgi:hypothetical protein